MKTIFPLAALLALVLAVPLPAQEAPAEPWLQLFNGRDLEGWVPKIKGHPAGANFANTFRVEDGILRVAYDGYDSFGGRFGHLFHAVPFSHYRLRVEYRFVGEQVPGGPGWAFRNSGIMVHGQTPESMRLDQDFPVSIEVQLLGGRGDVVERPTANVCTPGTHIVMGDTLVTRHCTSSSAKTFHGDQWVTVEVEVKGSDSIRHLVNGEVVLEYREPQLDANDRDAKGLIRDGQVLLSTGTISLQSESHPVEFRKVEILKLEPR